MEINIGNIIVEEEIEISGIELDLVKEYPKLEDIEITPSTTDKVYKSENYYGYNEVLVKGVEGGLVSVEDYYLEETTLYVLLSNGQTLVIDISESEDTEFTIQEIEEMIISELENKTIGEVES